VTGKKVQTGCWSKTPSNQNRATRPKEVRHDLNPAQNAEKTRGGQGLFGKRREPGLPEKWEKANFKNKKGPGGKPTFRKRAHAQTGAVARKGQTV